MKKYLSDIIGEGYREWGKRKIVISTPCGSGKTTFMLKTLYPYYRKREMKVLMVCNRNALKMQYENVLRQSSKDVEETKGITFVTYQKLGMEVKGADVFPQRYYKYDVICFDEVHSLVEEIYNNTYFNLFRVICETMSRKCLIFMSATIEPIRPYLKDYEADLKKRGMRAANPLSVRSGYTESEYQFVWYEDIKPDYGHVDIVGVDGVGQLMECIAKDVTQEGRKVLVFSENKQQISSFKSSLKQLGIREEWILSVDAKKMNDGTLEEEKVEMLLAERIPENKKVVLSTKVLDNGITLRSDGGFSICALCENKTEFIQMVSRIRVNDNQRIKLYVIEKSAEDYNFRIKQLKDAYSLAECYWRYPSATNYERCVDNDIAKTTLFTWSSKKKIDLADPSGDKFAVEVRINCFAVKKIEQDCFDLEKLKSALSVNERALAELQASWLGCDPIDIHWMSAEHNEEIQREFLLGKFKDLSKDEFYSMIKEFSNSCLSQKQFKEYTTDKDGTMSRSKMEKFCDSLGLTLVVAPDTNRRNRYTIVENEG